MAERLVHRVPEAADLLRMSPDFVWDLIRNGTLRARKQGRYLVITDRDLRAYVDALPDAPNALPATVTPMRPVRVPRDGRRVKKLVPLRPLEAAQS